MYVRDGLGALAAGLHQVKPAKPSFGDVFPDPECDFGWATQWIGGQTKCLEECPPGQRCGGLVSAISNPFPFIEAAAGSLGFGVDVSDPSDPITSSPLGPIAPPGTAPWVSVPGLPLPHPPLTTPLEAADQPPTVRERADELVTRWGAPLAFGVAAYAAARLIWADRPRRS